MTTMGQPHQFEQLGDALVIRAAGQAHGETDIVLQREVVEEVARLPQQGEDEQNACCHQALAGAFGRTGGR